MADRGAIINAALHHLSEEEVLDPLVNTSTWVRRVRNRYEERTRALFEAHSWNFATTVQLLAASEPTPEGWAYGYNKPAGCWCILKVSETARPEAPPLRYEDRGGRICADAESVYLTFVDRYWKDFEGSWPQCFADALAADLAWKVAPVTGKATVNADAIGKIAKATLKQAKNWDAIQMRHWQPPPGRWEQARVQGRGRRYDNG